MPVFNFDYFYWSGDFKMNGDRYAHIDLSPLKKLFVMSESHCSAQL